MSGFSLCSTFPGAAAVRFPLVPGKQFVGRSSHCDVVLKDLSVSRKHAEIAVIEGSVSVTDLGSCNGTFIDGQRVRTGQVTHGQQVRFGKVGFYLVRAEDTVGEANSEVETDSCRGVTLRPGAADELSPAQQRIYKLLVEGLAEKQIATRLDLSQHTVHNHVRAIYEHFKVHSRAEFLALLLHRQADPPPGP